MDEATRFRRALEHLWEEQGRPERDDDDDVLGVLVRMILGQATSKQNASTAFGNLLDRFEGNWQAVENAAVEAVVEQIEIGGLSRQKAPRIQKLLARVREDFGEYTLEPVREMEPDDALDYMLGFDGVGPTTARFALMYAAGLDVFPINGGIRRVLERLGVLDGSESDRVAHQLAAEYLPAGWAYPAHMTLVRHARAVCTKRAPDCVACAARTVCSYAADG